MADAGGLCPDCGQKSVVLEVWANEGGTNRCKDESCGWWEPAVEEESDND